MGIKVVKSGNEIIEDGIYAAEVKSLEERHNNGKRSYIFYFIVKSKICQNLAFRAFNIHF